MKFALAIHGTRGDIEPAAAVGIELLRRGHSVRMAVPPDLIGFVESAGLSAVPYGPVSQDQVDGDFFHQFWSVQSPMRLLRAAKNHVTQGWADMSATLTSLADGADLLLTGTTYQQVAAHVAEYYDIPLAALHYFPVRVNGQLLPIVPSPIIRTVTSVAWWLYGRMTKDAEDEQRRVLGLQKVTGHSEGHDRKPRPLEIQAYDPLFFPGLAAEWGGQRPFVGALTMELTTAVDDDVASWISAGTPPIYFGFGSMPLASPADTVALISAACAQLGERALICGANFQHLDDKPVDQLKVVSELSHAAIFPACRAVVHHGGAGTTAAGVRAGIPTLILWVSADQPIWAAQVKRLKVGSAKRLSTISPRSLAAELRTILSPQYVTRAREIATKMTKPTASVAAAADLLEKAVPKRC